MEGAVQVMLMCRGMRKEAGELRSETEGAPDHEAAANEGEGGGTTIGSLRAAQRLLSIKARLQLQPRNTHASEVDDEQEHMQIGSEKWIPLDEREWLSGRLVFQLMENLYRDHPGAVWRAASRAALDQHIGKEHGAKNLVYGEISFIALEALLSKYVPLASHEREKRGEGGGLTFYDLGCGAGRVVFTASLLHQNITKSCGVEILRSMHRMNKELLSLYMIEVAPKLHKVKQKQSINFIHGDFLKVDFSEADLLFSNATCFEDDLFEKLENHAKICLKKGSIIITVTRCFTDQTNWELLERQERRMSWSHAMVYVQRRR